MSAFGAIPVSLRNGHITYIISSANKCIEGVPGFSFVICKKQHLLTCQGKCISIGRKRIQFLSRTNTKFGT
jgi:2-aminoethylphosphonate-pyruvate transaminase